ncbi:MAG TPA: hypothetical protein VIO11_05140 [Candidatus Methanoperedens sp.]
MKILLVEPDYYTKYPPLGLMKLASYHRSRGNQVKLIRGINSDINLNPDRIEITSLFTYAWSPVHNVIEFYHNLFPDAKIEVGGIYASIMPERIRSFYPFVNVHVGLYEAAEHYSPAYDILIDIEKWKDWNSSIIFTSRGCIRNCPFCIVPKMEGKIRSVAPDVQNYIYPEHKTVTLWDNNFLASPDWKEVIKNLQETGLKIDFNQGLDARLIDEEKARMLADLRMPILRMAYDGIGGKKDITKAVNLLEDYGLKRRNILFYTLYNFYDSTKSNGDTPDVFLAKLKDIQKLGCVSYPMRFEPLTSLKKNQYISPLWTTEHLEAIAKARRVIGYGGAFPPYEGLIKKFENAKDFTDAFGLYPEVK